MITITAIIRTKQGHDSVMKDALLDVAKHVQADEPQTIDFYISQDMNDPCVFTTYERFTSVEAMEHHNSSEAVAKFFDIAKPILSEKVILVSSEEISSKIR